ncbi:MAG TPA: c-type cytochrome biogenesis protein CcsB, partial [bacterium]|nr:c-type cytochrome biogenesis protein CcsB [bacterium]
HTVNWIWRWVYSGQPPYIYLDEMTVFLVWCMVAGYLFFEYTTGHRFAGGIVAVLAVLGNGYASSVGTPVPKPLIPALQSYWVQIHVMSYIVGYGFAVVGYVIALLHLSHETGKNRILGRIVLAISIGMVAAVSLQLLLNSSGQGPVENLRDHFSWGFAVVVCVLVYAGMEFFLRYRLSDMLPGNSVMYDLNYRCVAMSYPFLTLGIITGAIWANEAWGRYWGWDPKESLALITWLVYGLFLHQHINAKWRTAGNVWVSIVGFWALMFTWLGVNYVLSGLHSYA